MPEEPASLLIDRLAGKWAIAPHSSSTYEEIFQIPRMAKISLDCDCLLRATQQARLPLKQGTALVEPSLSFNSRCINTGILMIRSIKHIEKRSWGKIWTTPAISSTTCGSGTLICSKCADKRGLVGSIAQHQRSRPRLAERAHSSPVSQREGLSCRSYGEVPEHPNKYGNTQLRAKYRGGYLKECAVFGSAPCALSATALSSRGEPHRYKEMRHNHLG